LRRRKSVANRWRDLYDKIPADRRARIEDNVRKDLVEMRLAEVRRARDLTQQGIAAKLNVNQAWVSKLERQADMYVSTLRSYIKAMGGELEIVARFGDGVVRLSNFEELGEAQASVGQAEPQAQSATAPIAGTTVTIWSRPPSGDSVIIWDGGDSETSGQTQTPRARTPERRVA
jgi:transcriptional regulator with XRE-family HTH domain